MTSRSFTRAPFLGVALASPASSSAQMRLSPLIGDGMAIQRGVQVPVRCRTAPGSKDVGARLALAARRVAHGEDLVHSGSAHARHQGRGGSS